MVRHVQNVLKFFFINLFVNHHFFSGQCYRRQMQPLLRSTTNSQNNLLPPHSIRLVEIPWTKGNKGGIRLSVDESQVGAPISAGVGCPGVRISE